MEKKFEAASRMKLRFAHKGQCTVEDLWDLSLPSLDGIYKQLRADQKRLEGDSLLSSGEGTQDVALAFAVDIVTHVVRTKQAEAQARTQAAEKRAKKARILEIIESKQDEALQGKSVEELRALLDE